jgi:hypothetical protein
MYGIKPVIDLPNHGGAVQQLLNMSTGASNICRTAKGRRFLATP